MPITLDADTEFDAPETRFNSLALDDSEFFRGMLEERRERIVESRGQPGAGAHLDLVDLLDPSGDVVEDYASDERAELLLEQIDTALEKLDEGTFGECDACGDDIEHGRLLVWPAAPICDACGDLD